jgi:hypothetical protein
MGLKEDLDNNISNPLEQNRLIAQAIEGHILNFDSDASAGGAAAEAMTVTGLLATDTILSVDQTVQGAGAGNTIESFDTQIDDGLTVTWDADPGAGAIVRVSVRRAQ